MKLSARPKASLLAITAILMALGFVPALSTPSRAQDAAQEPPGRVGRLGLIDGTVSYHTADQNYWQRARRNYPVTTGQSFWTEPNSHAAIDIAPNRIYLDGSTELDISALDDKFVIFYAGLINQFVDATSEQCSAPRTNLFPKLWRRLAHPAGRNRQRTFG